MEGVNIEKSTLKLLELVKLTRLFRLGRIVTYIQMSKAFKHSAKLLILWIYLLLIIHWMCCASYYIYQ